MSTDADVPAEVLARIRQRSEMVHRNLQLTVRRRERAYRELMTSIDPIDQAVARVYRDFLLQVEELERSRAATLVAAGQTGEPLVGRVAVFDEDRELLVVPWHAPEGQRHITARTRLMITEREDASLGVHRLTADAPALAARIREAMRHAARRDSMSDPLTSLTTEQGAVLDAVASAEGDVVITGPPGSGKSAIALLDLARRVLSHPEPHSLEVLFVTGTSRLAQRAESLSRLLGVASIRPVVQADLPELLEAGLGPSPVAGEHPGADGADVPRRIEEQFEMERARLGQPQVVAHPLGHAGADEIAAVRSWRARETTLGYASVARRLREDIEAEYQRLLPGSQAARCAEAAADQLRPALAPSELVRRALPDVRLPRSLRGAALACARSLLETRPRGIPPRWDLVIVDEYQRLPGLFIWLLRRAAKTLVLSGDTHQAFTQEDVRGDDKSVVLSLTTSLRLPAAISTWIDATWHEHGLTPPRIVSAAEGGEVRTSVGAAASPSGGAQVIAPASLASKVEPWLSPLEALGLEWPDVILVAPEMMLEEHGAPGLFVAATRAIDTLTIDPSPGS